MSTESRHPIYWPKMKIRGHRRRALAAERRPRVVKYAFPHAHITFSDGGREGTLIAHAAVSGGDPLVMTSTTFVDGFGRTVRP